jgi:mevalonate kinase
VSVCVCLGGGGGGGGCFVLRIKNGVTEKKVEDLIQSKRTAKTVRMNSC